MFSSGSSRKPLIRSNSSDRPTMRNWPLFGFLFGLVLFIYIFYIYQAQSTEASLLREQFDSQLLLSKNLKNELIDVKADLERIRASASSATSLKDEFSNKFDECSTALRTSKLKSESLQFEKTKSEEAIKEKDTLIEELKKNVDVLQRNSTALESLLATQQALANQLNQTVLILQTEVTDLKSSRDSEKQNRVADSVPANVEKLDTTVKTADPVASAAAVQPPAPVDSQLSQTLPKTVAPTSAATEKLSVAIGNEANPLLAQQEQGDTAAEKDDDAVPQIAMPRGPGDRLRVEETNAAMENRPMVQGGDYEDKQEPPQPRGPMQTGDEAPAPF